MRLILLACAVGALGGIMEAWRPGSAYWVNIAGLGLFLFGILRWLAGGKRNRRNETNDGDTAFPSSNYEISSLDSGSCGSDSGGCGDGGGGGD